MKDEIESVGLELELGLGSELGVGLDRCCLV